MNILVVQREKKQGEYIAKGLKESGYSVDYTDNLEEASHLLEMISYNLAIIDTVISKKSGLDFCKSIKSVNNSIGILFLSSDTDINIKVKALECGGDDYVVKPFPFIELLARVKAILRRTGAKSMVNNTLSIKGLTLNYLTREAYREERKIELTSKEFSLLEYFMRNKNIVLTRTVLKEQIWGIDFLSDTNIVDVYVTHLRNKIDKEFNYKFLHTVRGAGYIFKG